MVSWGVSSFEKKPQWIVSLLKARYLSGAGASSLRAFFFRALSVLEEADSA